MRYISEEGHKKRKNRETKVMFVMLLVLIAAAVFLLVWGDQVYPISTVMRVLFNEDIKGASYAIKTIRLPRIIIGILTGFSFGVAGNIFQKLMRNPLASPDVMGITSGASAAAVFSMMVLKLSASAVSISALLGGLLTASFLLFISRKSKFSINKMILTGIGIQAMLQAVINFVILKTSDYNISDALRWLSGSLNGVRMYDVPRLLTVVVIMTAAVLFLERDLQVLMLGEELPETLGLPVKRARLLLIFSAVILSASSISVTGPLSSVAFMAGPITTRLLRTGGVGSIPSGMLGAIIVLLSEAVGQFAFETRYPVGVITGLIGAPYLIYLLIRMNKQKG